jgi:hypothetical protein
MKIRMQNARGGVFLFRSRGAEGGKDPERLLVDMSVEVASIRWDALR